MGHHGHCSIARYFTRFSAERVIENLLRINACRSYKVQVIKTKLLKIKALIFMTFWKSSIEGDGSAQFMRERGGKIGLTQEKCQISMGGGEFL